MKTPSPDESCDLLRAELEARRPFVHAKWGDGHIQVMHGTAEWTRSADGELQWSDKAAASEYVTRQWTALRQRSEAGSVFLGDWRTCSDTQGINGTYEQMIAGAPFRMVHYEALLMHRLSPALLSVYRALRDYPGRKLLVTSHLHLHLSEMLHCYPVFAPRPGHYERCEAIAEEITHTILRANIREMCDMVIFAAGGIGAAVQALLLEHQQTNITQVNIGSGMDLISRGVRTRSGQVPVAEAREYFAEFLK